MSLLNFKHWGILEAGCDEAGRGALAGPVFAAAVIWPADLKIEGIRDSKQMTANQREDMALIIRENAIAYGVDSVDVDVIGAINILNASILAMQKAVEQLDPKPEYLLIDGNRFSAMEGFQHETIIKGDSIYTAIAAASILAKTERDALMKWLHEQNPEYEWKNNKGYGTLRHRQAILEFGLSPHHRSGFCKKLTGKNLDLSAI